MKETAAMLMEYAPAFIYAVAFLIGICTGSFLNVCIYRLPKKESIVYVPSHCMSCGKKLHWYELFPLFSWLFLRGKCLGCKAKISPQYPLVEFANGIIWVACLYFKGLCIDTALCATMMSALLVIAVIDTRTREIPFCINVFIFVLALGRLALQYPLWLDRLLGFGIMGGLFFLIWFISGGAALGGGDWKLMFACGLFLGLKATVVALVVACVGGSILHLLLMAIKKVGRRLAFGPYLAAGYTVAALFGTQIAEWYLGTFFTF